MKTTIIIMESIIIIGLVAFSLRLIQANEALKHDVDERETLVEALYEEISQYDNYISILQSDTTKTAPEQ